MIGRKVALWIVLACLLVALAVVVVLMSAAGPAAPRMPVVTALSSLPTEVEPQGSAGYYETVTLEAGTVVEAACESGRCKLAIEDFYANREEGEGTVELTLSRDSAVRLTIEEASPGTRVKLTAGKKRFVTQWLPARWAGSAKPGDEIWFVVSSLAGNEVLEGTFRSSEGLEATAMLFDNTEDNREASAVSGGDESTLRLVVRGPGLAGAALSCISGGSYSVTLRKTGYEHTATELPCTVEGWFTEEDTKAKCTYEVVIPVSFPEASYLHAEVAPEAGLDVALMSLEEDSVKVMDWATSDAGEAGAKEVVELVKQTSGKAMFDVIPLKGSGKFVLSVEQLGRKFRIGALPYQASQTLKPPDEHSRNLDVYMFAEPVMGSVEVELIVPPNCDMDLTAVLDDGKQLKSDTRQAGVNEHLTLKMEGPQKPVLIIDSVKEEGRYEVKLRYGR